MPGTDTSEALSWVLLPKFNKVCGDFSNLPLDKSYYTSVFGYFKRLLCGENEIRIRLF